MQAADKASRTAGFRHGALGALIGACAGAAWGIGPVAAAELLVFERAGCVWCQRFEREVAPIYPRTDEGRLAPLRRVDLGDEDAALADLAAPVRYAPTFVLVENGREVARLAGYAGQDAFWGLLAEMTKKLSQTP